MFSNDACSVALSASIRQVACSNVAKETRSYCLLSESFNDTLIKTTEALWRQMENE
jgi:hypothetical protein